MKILYIHKVEHYSSPKKNENTILGKCMYFECIVIRNNKPQKERKRRFSIICSLRPVMYVYACTAYMWVQHTM